MLSDQEVASRAVARGVLTQQALDAALAERRRLLKDGLEVSLKELLVERGHLDEHRWRTLAENGGPTTGATSGPAASTPGRSMGETAGSPGAGDAAGAVRGEVLGGYRIVKELGRGAMGIVYEALQEKLGRRVALKVLPETQALQGVARERFLREAQATASLHHPSIVPIYDVGEERGVHFFAMELLDGRSLKQLLEEQGPTAPEEAARIARDVADALAYAHEQGVVHRDVKPDNVIVRPDGRVVITDFGLAQRLSDVHLTREGTIVGTPLYMAPEQARGDGNPVDGRADIYCLGVTLYELVSGKAPFEDSRDTAVLLERVVHDDPIPLGRVTPGAPAPLQAIVEVALEKDPARRFQTARAMAEDLARFLKGEPIRARPPTRLTRTLRAVRRRGRALLAGTLVGTLLLAGGWGLRQGLRRWEADRQVLEAVRLEGLGDVAGADSALQRALTSWPALAEARFRAAQLRLQRGDAPASVLAELDRALLDEPRHAEALVLRGVLRRGAGELDEALGDFERARVAGEGRDARAHLGEGLVLMALARPAEALTRLQEGLSVARRERAPLDPLYREAVLALGGLYLDQGRPKEALPELEEAVRNEPGSVPQRLLARALVETGNLPAALEALSAALRRDPADLEARTLRAAVARRTGDYALAMSDLEQVADRPVARLARGLIRFETIAHLKQPEAGFEDGPSRDDLEAVADLPELPAADRALAYGALAWLELAAPRPRRSRATAHVDRAIELAPQALGARLLRVRLLTEQERSEEALAELKGLPQEHYAVRVILARLLAEAGDLPAARSLLDQAIQSAPERPTALAERYLVRLRMSDPGAQDDRNLSIARRDPAPARPFALEDDPFLLSEEAYGRGWALYATLVQAADPKDAWIQLLSRGEAWVSRALLFDPRSLPSLSRLGSLRYLLGRSAADAAAAYGQAHELDPGLPDARIAQAVIERDLLPGAGPAAAVARLRGLLGLPLRAAIEAAARFELAKALLADKDEEGALAELEAAAKAGPATHAIAALRARLATRLGRPDAEALALAAAKLLSEGQHDKVRGYLYGVAGDRFEEDDRDRLAHHFFDRALEADPTNGQSWRKRAEIRLRRPDELPLAFVDTFMCAELIPSEADRFLEIEGRVDRFAMLLPFFEERVDDMIKGLPDLPAPLFFKGYLAFYGGRYADAEPWFDRTLTLAVGRSHLASVFRAATRLRLGRAEEAGKDLEAAAALAPDAALVHFWRACWLATRGEREEAIGLLEKVAGRGVLIRDQISRAPELAGLREDPRVQALVTPR